MQLPVILSLAGHVAALTLLILFMTPSRSPEPLEKSGIAVAFAPFAAQPQVAALAPAPPVQPLASPTVAAVPPEATVPPLPAPEMPPAAVAQVPVVPPEQTVSAEAPPLPPRKPAVRPRPRYVARRQEVPLPRASRYAQTSPARIAALRYSASAPAASVPGPGPAVNYRALISAWFESHKRYPDSARERGEEGSVGLRFRVDRYGRVIDYALLNSTGYADLDQSVEEMMNGAQLPAFPAGMTQPQIEVSVRIAFSLTR